MRSAGRAGLWVLAAAAVAVAAAAQETGNGSLTVVITGLRSSQGRVHVSLYDKEEGFPRDEAAILHTRSVEPEGKQVTVEFPDLAFGDYAIAVLHDEDLSGSMTYRSLHRPKEGYCFSNNLRPKIRAPKWKKARFRVGREPVILTLRMIYWGGGS